MKNFIYVLFGLLFLLSCASVSKYKIYGNDKGFPNGYKVYLCMVQGEEEPPVLLNSTVIADGSFTLAGNVDAPHGAVILVCDSTHIDESTFELLSEEGQPFVCNLFLEPGEIHITPYNKAKNQSAVASGTPLNDLYNKFEVDCDSVKNSAVNDPYTLFAFVAPFIKANVANPVGTTVFECYHWSMPQEMKLELLDSLQVYYGDKYAGLRAETVELLELQNKRAEQRETVQSGNKYKDITEKDIAGKNVSLGETVDAKKNNYVLLDFWATYCAPCIMEIPILLDAYKEYANKGLEIYSVSLDSDVDASTWRSMLEEKNMPWINVRADENSDVRDKYGIYGIPANFLIDCATGEIIAVNLRGDELLQKMSQLF